MLFAVRSHFTSRPRSRILRLNLNDLKKTPENWGLQFFETVFMFLFFFVACVVPATRDCVVVRHPAVVRRRWIR